MTQKKRKVELFRFRFEAINNNNTKIGFYDFAIKYLNNKAINEIYKDTYFDIKEDTSNYFIIGVVTTKMYGIPPKNDIVKHKTGALPLLPNEGIAYSNIILYDKTFKILYYEFNQNGLWASTFVDHILGMQQTAGCPYDINASIVPILRKKAYKRLMEFGRYSQIELQIANPDGLVISEITKTDSLLNIIKCNQGLDAEVLNYTYKVDTRKSDSTLDISTVRRMIKQAKNILSGSNTSHLTKLKITGYHGEDDGPQNRKDTIDLVNDKFSRTFEINEPRVRNDLQFVEKKKGIVNVYNRCLPEIKELFKKK